LPKRNTTKFHGLPLRGSLAALKATTIRVTWSGSTKTSGRLPSDQQPDNLSSEDIQKLEKAEAVRC
jgi:hypothetical protein